MQQAPRVLLRIRPSSENAQLIQQDGQAVLISGPKPDRAVGKAGSGPQYQFKFDSVLQSATQEEVYEVAAADVLKSALEGYNCTIMCYGQTGAGKTYTMSGGRKQTFTQRGLIPRVITQLFTELKSTPSQECEMAITYLEIYNDSLYDLLDITTAPHELNVYEDRSGKVNIVGLRTAVVQSEREALALLFEGEANRVISEHQLNRESSRSHAIFTIILKMRTTNDLSGTVVSSKLNLVDLAGSERVSKTKSEGTVLKEAAHINKSLSILEQVVLALGEGSDHVPFRSSKLTHVLKDAVGGNCKTVMVANVWGEASQVNETLSTCRFAMRLLRLKCQVTPNVIEDAGTRIRALQSQVWDLQQQLGKGPKNGSAPLLGSNPELNNQQRALIRQQVSHFLFTPCASRSLAPLDLSSTHATLLCVRELYQQHTRGTAPPALLGSIGGTACFARPLSPLASRHLDHQHNIGGMGSAVAGMQSKGGKAGAGNLPPLQQQQQQQQQIMPHSSQQQQTQQQQQQHLVLHPPQQFQPWQGEGVGEVEEDADHAQSGGVGVAPGSQYYQNPPLPPNSEGGGVGQCDSGYSSEGESCQNGSISAQHDGCGEDGAEGRARSGMHAGTSSGLVREATIEEYKKGPGASKAGLLLDNKARLKELKRRAKGLGLGINAAKHELDSLKPKAEMMKAVRQGQDAEQAQVLGADEYSVLMRMKELKSQYKDQFTELQMVRSEIDYTQQLCNTCTQEFVEDFNAWFIMEHRGVEQGIQSGMAGISNGNASICRSAASSALHVAEPNQSQPAQGVTAHHASTRRHGIPGLTSGPVRSTPPSTAGTLQPAAPATGVMPSKSVKGDMPEKKALPSQRLRGPGPNEADKPGAAAFYAAQNAHMPGVRSKGQKSLSYKKQTGAPPAF